MSDQNQAIMNAEQAAQRLGLSKSTLAKMRLSGRGPRYVKLGRRVGYAQNDLDNWISLNKFRSTSEYDVGDKSTGNKTDDLVASSSEA